MNTVLLTTTIIGAIGAICGIALAVAARFLAVKVDPRIETMTGILPGANCGGCGFAGCADYARAMVIDGAVINLCAPGGSEVMQRLATALGRDAMAAEKKVAVVLCGGKSSLAPRKNRYNGVADCGAAHAVNGGDKLCAYGCLGYGSCARVCPVGAIEITADALAVVHPELCIGCGACVRTCPRRLIKMVPEARSIHVLCSSPDKGPAVKKACQVGCIGCRVCTKLVDNEQIVMNGFLAVVNYDRPLENDAVVEKCPSHCIVKRLAPADPAKPAGGQLEILN